MQQLTPEQADNVIRASWPRPYADTLREINYAAMCAECSNEPDEDGPRAWMRRNDLAIALACVIGAWLLFVVAPTVALLWWLR